MREMGNIHDANFEEGRKQQIKNWQKMPLHEGLTFPQGYADFKRAQA